MRDLLGSVSSLLLQEKHLAEAAYKMSWLRKIETQY
jgi:hypothetical protein